MCGIAGFYGDIELGEDKLESCLRLLRRRGPDANGRARLRLPGGDRCVHLLHTRLSILDLDPRSNQPFRLGGKTIVFNGEIYNYVELREELRARGRSFVTTGDTEVLLVALDEYGLEALDRFEGMWAFAMYDAADGSLTLSRDRFGEKPLYLYENRNGLFFGSEIKALSALSGDRFAPNLRALDRYLVNGYKSIHKTDESFFEGVSLLPSGCVLRLGPAGAKTEIRYWTPKIEEDETLNLAEAARRVRERLTESVKIRLRSDRPLAFCLSGGIDSNALLGVAVRELGHEAHGFTIVNRDARYEESECVEEAVRAHGIRHTTVSLHDEGFLEGLDRLVEHHDAPVYTISYYVHWLLMEEVAKRGYRIAISGTGADELFSGYYDHHNFYLREVHGSPEGLAALENWRRRVAPIVRNPFLKDPELFVNNPNFRGHIYLDREKFAGFLKEPFDEPFREAAYCGSLLRNRMMNELFHESVPVILHEDDLNAMYWSVENRSPFLDRKLFEIAASIPSRLLVGNGLAKRVLREAMRGIVPDKILDNPRKVGFNAPIFDLLDPSDPAVRARILDDGPVFDIVRKEAIERLLSKSGLPNSESKFLFYFLNAKMFLERFAA